MFSFFRKTGGAVILTAALAAAFLLFAACEQPAGVVRDDDATLKTLAVDRGKLSPAFSASHFEYRVMVRNANDAITVTAAANSGKAAVSGVGTKTLLEGGNTISVVVKAESGVIKTYTITVTRLDGIAREIKNAQDMAKIGVDDEWSLLGDYRLANDIALDNWLPIGDRNAPFAGVFEGNKNKITLNGFNAEAVSEKTFLGIFGYVEGLSAAEKAEIKNLTIHSSVDSSSTAAEGQYIGLAAGRAENAVLDAITLTGSFKHTSANVIYLGGAAGEIGAGTAVKNINSQMNMDIKPGASPTYHWVGGIAGRFIGGAGIENCHVTANITADNVAAAGSGQVFAGGITGGSQMDRADGSNTPAYYGYIQDSSFNGTLIGRAKGFWTYAGGIAGVTVGGSVNNNAATTHIVRCSAAGTVSVAGTNSGWPYVGGIVGYNNFGALVSQCYSTAAVVGAGSGDYTGGIAGYNAQSITPHNARIEDCWSGGTITGSHNAGGIVGQNQQNARVARCYSIAAVSATGGNTGIGGIAGLNGYFAFQGDLPHDAGGNITACVALNVSITAGSGTKVHRVIGAAQANTTMTNNHARSDMTVTTGGTDVTVTAGDNTVDGADCDEKPNQSFYTGLDWDFANVWEMHGDYPRLKWQQ